MQFSRLAAAMALGIAGLAPALSAPTLSILPGQQSIGVGDSAQVDIVISGLDGVNEIVSAFDLNVGFNTSVLVLNSLSLGPPDLAALGGLSGTIFAFDSDDSDGDIGGDATSFLTDDELDALQGDSLTLMGIVFTGLTDGVSLLNFGADPNFQRLVTGRLDSLGIAGVLDLTYVGACIAVGTGSCTTVPVPEPASYGLAGLALLGCGIATARRRRTAAPVVA